MNQWERISLLAAAILVAVPAANLVGVIVLQRADSRAAYLLAIVTAFIGYRYLRPGIRGSRISLHQHWPVLLALLVQGCIILSMSTAFLALPDVDPYHWIKIYRTDFLPGHFNYLAHRPLFYSLVFLIDTLLPLTPEQVFKYAVPSLSAIMLIPAWLVARRLDSRLQQLVLLLLPSVSSALIISTQVGTPQAVLNIVTAFFVYFLLYSLITKQPRWHHAAGLIVLISSAYHGLAFFLFSVWLVSTAWHSRYRWFVPLILASTVLLSLPYATNYLSAASQDIRLNLTFPYASRSIDGISTGWPTLLGIMQYYAFYAGLPVVALLAVAILYAVRRGEAKSKLKELFLHQSSLTLITLLVTFLLIAEVLPRLFNIVILPERAWLITALMTPVVVLTFPSRIPAHHSVTLLLLFCLSVAGALYVNDLKKYNLPDYVITSARWISQNIPASAEVASNRSPDYLDLYTNSSLKELPDSFYCENRDVNAQELLSKLQAKTVTARYLYLAVEDPRHAYAQRPWQQPIEASCIPEALQQDSRYFKNLYRDGNLAGVWEIL